MHQQTSAAEPVLTGNEVTRPSGSKLIVTFDADQNKYSPAAHNQTAEEAQILLDQWTQHLREGISFVALDQAKLHATKEPQKCRACGEAVTRSAHFPTQPTFKRRNV